MLRKYVVLALAVLLIVSPARAWEKAGWGGGGFFTYAAYDVTDQNVIYQASDVNGLWKSTSGGDWVSISTGLLANNVASFVQSPSSTGTFYVASGSVGTSAGVWKTTDGGATWTQKSTTHYFNRGNTIDVSKTDANKVYIGTTTYHGFASTDGGTNWTDLGVMVTGESVYSVALEGNGRYLWFGTAAKCSVYDLQLSSNSVKTLTGSVNPTSNKVIRTFGTDGVYIASGNRIAVSTDHGANFTYTNPVTAVVAGGTGWTITKMDTSADGTTIAVVAVSSASDSIVSVSNDSGTTWSSSANYDWNAELTQAPSRTWRNDLIGDPPSSIRVSPYSDSDILATTDWSIHRSTNGGTSFPEITGDAQVTMIEQIAIAPDGSWLVTSRDNGLMRSTDKGETWTNLVPNATLGASVGGHAFGVMALGTEAQWNAGAGTIVVGYQKWSNYINTVYRSTDSGATFTNITSGLPTEIFGTGWGGYGAPRKILKSHVNPNTLWMAIQGLGSTQTGGVYKSTDAGVTWTASAADPAQLLLWNGFALDPNDPTGLTLLWGGFSADFVTVQIYRTTDGGANWSTLTGGGLTWDVLTDGTNIWAGAGSSTRINTSHNMGSTWAYTGNLQTATASLRVMDMEQLPDGTVLAGVKPVYNSGAGSTLNKTQIYKSASAWRAASSTWTDITGNLTETPAGVSTIAVDVDSKLIVIGTYGGGVYKASFDEQTGIETSL